MPELPDLEVFAANLDKQLKAAKLDSVVVSNHSRLNVPVQQLQKTLEGQVLKEVSRSGKELCFSFSNSHLLTIHLMLHGRLYFFEGSHKHKYAVVELLFENDSCLVLTDFQGSAHVTLDPPAPSAPDALSHEVDAGFLKQKFSRSRAKVKALLLDQHFIRGIGNAYADEILFEAGISPLSVAGKVPDEAIARLAASIRSVLKDAVRQIRKRHPDIISGEIRDFLKVHRPDMQVTATGATIRQQAVASRKTYFTDDQEYYQ